MFETNLENVCPSGSTISNSTSQSGLTCLKQDTDAARDVSFSK